MGKLIPMETQVAPKMKNKCRSYTPAADLKSHGRCRITNGRDLLPGVDGRSVWPRRLRDLISLHLSDLGGEGAISEAEKCLIRRAACLTVELEHMELTFACNGEAFL